SVGEKPSIKTLTLRADVIGNQHVSLTNLTEDGDHRILWLGIVTADQAVILTLAEKRRIQVVLSETAIDLVPSQDEARVRMRANVVVDQTRRAIAGAIIDDDDLVADRTGFRQRFAHRF